MPTKRFENLQQDKKEAIIKAVTDEFKRTSCGELRISRIAQNAAVSDEAVQG